MSRKKKIKLDPAWLYPHATRAQIEKLRAYFAELESRPLRSVGWTIKRAPGSHNRKSNIPWSTVRPDLRQQCQEWFDNRIARYKAEGRAITSGIINSVRGNATRHGRIVLTHIHRNKTSWYFLRRKQWRQYLAWCAEQERQQFVASLGKTESRQLEI